MSDSNDEGGCFIAIFLTALVAVSVYLLGSTFQFYQFASDYSVSEHTLEICEPIGSRSGMFRPESGQATYDFFELTLNPPLNGEAIHTKVMPRESRTLEADALNWCDYEHETIYAYVGNKRRLTALLPVRIELSELSRTQTAIVALESTRPIAVLGMIIYLILIPIACGMGVVCLFLSIGYVASKKPVDCGRAALSDKTEHNISGRISSVLELVIQASLAYASGIYLWLLASNYAVYQTEASTIWIGTLALIGIASLCLAPSVLFLLLSKTYVVLKRISTIARLVGTTLASITILAGALVIIVRTTHVSAETPNVVSLIVEAARAMCSSL